jgi:hypothetical protein
MRNLVPTEIYISISNIAYTIYINSHMSIYRIADMKYKGVNFVTQ